jgi:hypothetical protein
MMGVRIRKASTLASLTDTEVCVIAEGFAGVRGALVRVRARQHAA